MLEAKDSTESLIESLHTSRKKRSLVINPDYLDDEKLPEYERIEMSTQN
jgi:cell division control protein 6